VIDSLDRGLIVLDRNLHVEFANPEAARILGVTPEQLRTWSVDDLLRCADGDSSLASIFEALAADVGQGPVDRKVCDDGRLRSGDGRTVPVSASVIPVRHDGAVHGAVVVLGDIRAPAPEMMRRLADCRGHHRRRLACRTGGPSTPTGAQLAAGGHFRALRLGPDRFKEVNDSLGTTSATSSLVQVSTRLAARLRDGDMLARLGGDGIPACHRRHPHRGHGRRGRSCVPRCPSPFAGGHRAAHRRQHRISPRAGARRRADRAAAWADIALYKAKSSHNGHHVYAGSDDTAGEARLRLLAELRTALTENQFCLHYQPKLGLADNDVHGVEALVRWDHPERGLLYPDGFLSLVEEAGLMRALTQIVLEQALDQAAAWRAQGRSLSVAVNLSASSLVDTDLPEQVSALLAARRLPADALQLEITEEFLMADRDRASSILRRLRDTGVQIAVDDFGTGYSSLAYLRELPIDELKLDRSFVFPMADDARAAALVFSTIGLAHSLGLRMVAEGVENEAALTELGRHGCDLAQGYFLSRPVPAAELELWLDARAQRSMPSHLNRG
jgi:PAS domain S-box-containing protein